MSAMTISGKALGSKRPLFADWSIPMPPDWGDGDSTTLRDLIDCVVREEVRRFQRRQEDRRVFRALTARQIADGAERGKIEAGGNEVDAQPVDADAAVAAAWQAFEDGMYLVVIDDTDYRNLDARIFVRPDSRITFVRLTLLAGG